LNWTVAKADPSEQKLVKVLLFPTRLVAFLTFRTNKYNQSITIAKQLASTSKDINNIWLTPYFDNPIDEVRKKLGIVTLQQIDSD
jgi:ubiquinone biosynthesis protein Coq4